VSDINEFDVPTDDDARRAWMMWRSTARCDEGFDIWLAGVKAEAVREAARAANQGFVDEQAGIGPARVRTDWLFQYADDLATSANAHPETEANHG
jgi:hypothetical protein